MSTWLEGQNPACFCGQGVCEGRALVNAAIWWQKLDIASSKCPRFKECNKYRLIYTLWLQAVSKWQKSIFYFHFSWKSLKTIPLWCHKGRTWAFQCGLCAFLLCLSSFSAGTLSSFLRQCGRSVWPCDELLTFWLSPSNPGQLGPGLFRTPATLECRRSCDWVCSTLEKEEIKLDIWNVSVFCSVLRVGAGWG